MTSHPAAQTSPETVAVHAAGVERHPVRDADLLVALDVDGTVLHHDGHLSARVVAGVRALESLPHVTVIGDTTGGASGNPATFALGNGWQFTVPRWMEYTPERLPIEGRGVAPHIAIRWTPGDYSDDRDPLIDEEGDEGEVRELDYDAIRPRSRHRRRRRSPRFPEDYT